MKRLRWKRQEKQRGLAVVWPLPRGYMFHDGKTVYARVHPATDGWGRRVIGWYWLASGGVPFKNTSQSPVATAEEAKAAAEQYVREHLEGR